MTDDRKCVYCDRPAEFACDKVVRRGATPGETALCDRLLCARHRYTVGHMCDRSRRTTNNHSDTIDYCPEHAGKPDPRDEPPPPDDCEVW